MSKKILIDASMSNDTRVVILEKNLIQDFNYENSSKKSVKGNIYIARVTRVEPSLQAAFIEYGRERHGFLPLNEIHPIYFENADAAKKDNKQLADKILPIQITETSDNDENTSSLEKLKVEDLDNFKDSEAENIQSEEQGDNEEENLNHSSPGKHKIQDVIHKGQLLLVQIGKEERGNKGASCTTYISLAGRYCVLMPNTLKQGGISRRIINYKDREYLKNILDKLELPNGVRVILRTAGLGKSLLDIKRDYFYLARLWNTICEHAINTSDLTFIHAETDLLKRTIRDLFSSETEEILIEGSNSFKLVKEFVKKILPFHINKIKEYKGKIPLFTKYDVEKQIAELFNPIAKLPSGGYIVINPTEALIAIDVNSGKATSEQNIEETAVKTNLEAASEVARQLRLRDMSGLVVIDFIDMEDLNHKRQVENALQEALASDRAKVQIGNISPFGLLELSRQRLQSSFMENNTIICPACNGKGLIKSFEANSLNIIRTLESEIATEACVEINVFAHSDVTLYIQNHHREQILAIENKHKCKVIFNNETTSFYDGFALEKKYHNELNKNLEPSLKNEEQYENYHQEEISAEVARNEINLGLGNNIAPLNVNENPFVPGFNDEASQRVRSNSHRRIPGKNPRYKGVNKKPENNNIAETPEINKELVHNRSKKRRFDRNRNRENRPVKAEKKSVLKSLWDKFVN